MAKPTTRVIFVCTGNTCRSPMARFMAERLARDAGLPWIVGSAGVSANDGAPLSQGAQRVLAAHGLKGLKHASRRIDAGMIAAADRIFAMTRAQRDAMIAEFPDHSQKIVVLREDAGLPGADIADPAGGTEADYERCAALIEEALKILIRRIPRA